MSTLCAKRDRPHVADLRDYYAHTAVGTLAEPLDRLAAKAWLRLEVVTGASPSQQRTWTQHDDFISRWWATRGARRFDTTILGSAAGYLAPAADGKHIRRLPIPWVMTSRSGTASIE